MRLANTETLHLRLPPDLRADLDAAAQGAPRGLSSVVRRALAAGLKVITENTGVDDDDVDVDDDPPPTGPAAVAQIPVAA